MNTKSIMPDVRIPRGPQTSIGRFITIWHFLLILSICTPAWADTWVATAYCACKSCCGKTDGITASGIKAKEGITVACNWLPFGSVMNINGNSYIVEDRGAKSIFGSKKNHIKRVDIFMASHKEALKFGKQKVEVML